MNEVLCVGTTDTCRGPITAELLQKELGDEFKVESAGILKRAGKGMPAGVYTECLMRKQGIDLIDHRSRWFNKVNLAQVTHIVCLDEVVEEYVDMFLAGYRTIGIILAREIPNPYQKGWNEHQECLARIEQEIPQIARQIRG